MVCVCVCVLGRVLPAGWGGVELVVLVAVRVIPSSKPLPEFFCLFVCFLFWCVGYMFC